MNRSLSQAASRNQAAFEAAFEADDFEGALGAMMQGVFERALELIEACGFELDGGEVHGAGAAEWMALLYGACERTAERDPEQAERIDLARQAIGTVAGTLFLLREQRGASPS